jgi:hypothetical protein
LTQPALAPLLSRELRTKLQEAAAATQAVTDALALAAAAAAAAATAGPLNRAVSGVEVVAAAARGGVAAAGISGAGASTATATVRRGDRVGATLLRGAATSRRADDVWLPSRAAVRDGQVVEVARQEHNAEGHFCWVRPVCTPAAASHCALLCVLWW